MSVVDTMRTARADWLSKRPWWTLGISYALVLIIGMAIGQGLRNADLFGKIAGSYHWQATHQDKPSAPSQVAPTKRD